MGRGFSTAYRFVLVVVSVSALVLTIMSATSCAFLNFEHQYKNEGRLLFAGERALQVPVETNLAEGATMEASPAEAAPSDGTPVDAVPADGAPLDGTPVDVGTDFEAPADSSSVNSGTDFESPADGAPVDGAPADGTLVDAGTDFGAPEAEVPALDAAAPDAEAQSPELPENSPTVPEVGVTYGEGLATEGSESAASPTAAGEGASMDEEDDDNYYGFGDVKDPNGYPADYAPSGSGGEQGEGAFGSAADTGSASAAEEPIATASGEAGLFCSGEQSFSITNLWKGSIQELEEDINEESDSNQSEEIARNAVLSAAVFGSVAVFVLVAEILIGWRVWFDKWIVALISLLACICQGVTFLFFNSERYCDGDIVHEILNQEPCVIGQGGVLSVVALVLYAIMIVMACRLPQDDPYGLCCKKNGSSRNDTSTKGSGKFGMLGGTPNGESDTARSGQERERPNWISEDSNAQDENEMI